MGSLRFASTLSGVLTTSDLSGGIAAGQRAVSPVGGSQPHTTALTLRPIDVFPMTHHVECAALVRWNPGARALMLPAVGCTGYAQG